MNYRFANQICMIVTAQTVECNFSKYIRECTIAKNLKFHGTFLTYQFNLSSIEDKMSHADWHDFRDKKLGLTFGGGDFTVDLLKGAIKGIYDSIQTKGCDLVAYQCDGPAVKDLLRELAIPCVDFEDFEITPDLPVCNRDCEKHVLSHTQKDYCSEQNARFYCEVISDSLRIVEPWPDSD